MFSELARHILYVYLHCLTHDIRCEKHYYPNVANLPVRRRRGAPVMSLFEFLIDTISAF